MYWAVSFVASVTHGSTVDPHFKQVGAHGQADVSITFSYDNGVFPKTKRRSSLFSESWAAQVGDKNV